MAGIAGEAKDFGKIRSGAAEKDLRTALDLVQDITYFSEGKYIPPACSDNQFKSPDFTKIFRNSLSEKDIELLESAYKAARYLLDCNKSAHKELRSRLQKDGTIPVDEIPLVLGNRFPMKMLSEFKVCFVHPGLKDEIEKDAA